VANFYSDYRQIGRGCGNLISYGVFETNNVGTRKLLEGGINTGGTARALNIARIREHVAHSWYRGTGARVPANGITAPLDPETKTDAYSWLKAPRYGSDPFEAGPLARMTVAGQYSGGISVMDRHLARALEARVVARAMGDWLDQLEQNLTGPVYRNYATPASATGVGLTEAPRGALGHWVNIEDGKVSNYQVITPTCWNASPMDSADVKGPMEQALIGTPVTDPNRPVEALRVIHSFDPCLSCAVHVMRPRGKPVVLKAGLCG
jgi:hydrogenase large subunit